MNILLAPSSWIPMGFKFHLTDEERMRYLVKKVTGLESLCCIGTVDLYGSKEPWDIFGGDCEERELYFFTGLKKVAAGNKNQSSRRISRNAGEGFWSNKGQRTSIYSRKPVVIGYKRCFKYQSKKGGDDDRKYGKWLLKEYTLPDKMKLGVREEFKDYALCVLKRKGGPRNNNNDRFEEERIGWFNSTSSTCQLQGDHVADKTPPDQGDEDVTEEWLLQEAYGDCDQQDRAEDMDEDHGSSLGEISNQPAAAGSGDNLVVTDDHHDIEDDDDDECSILETAPACFSNTPNLVECGHGLACFGEKECSTLAAAAAAPGLELDQKEEFTFGFSLEDNAAPNDHFPWNDPFDDDYFHHPNFNTQFSPCTVQDLMNVDECSILETALACFGEKTPVVIDDEWEIYNAAAAAPVPAPNNLVDEWSSLNAAAAAAAPSFSLEDRKGDTTKEEGFSSGFST